MGLRQALRYRIGSLALALAACGADDEAVYVDYEASDSLQVCGGTRAYINDFVPFLAGELGIARGRGLSFSWLDDAEYSAVDCPLNSAGCQEGTDAFSRYPVLLHEVVHTVTEANGMNGLPFFTEGVAVAYDPLGGGGSGPRYRFYPGVGEPWFDPREFMVGEFEPGYDVAGGFVTFLLMRHGPEKFVALTRALTRESDLQGVRSAFVGAYGVELDDEAELFRANAGCEEGGFDVRVFDCSGPELASVGGGWSWTPEMACESSMVVGGISPERGFMGGQSVAVEVSRGGGYVLRLEAVEGVRVTLGRCFGCPWAPPDSVVAGGESVELEMAPGPHFLRVSAPSELGPAVRVTLLPRA